MTDVPLGELGEVSNEPNLGLATTRELLEEIAARIRVSQTIGEDWTLDYSTVPQSPPIVQAKANAKRNR